MRLVFRGLIRYESLIDGTLTLEDLAELNDAVAVADENEYRVKRPRNVGH